MRAVTGRFMVPSPGPLCSLRGSGAQGNFPVLTPAFVADDLHVPHGGL